MSEKLTIDQLRKEQCYRALTEQQQRLVGVFLETGDKLKSVLAAYHCNSRTTARVMTYSYFAKPGVIACLAVANGGDAEREQFDAELHRAIKNPRTTRNQISALRLYAQTHGYFIPESEASPTLIFAVGDRVTQRDDAGVMHAGIVRAIDSDGRATQIEEVDA